MGFPIKNGDFPISYVNVYQRVSHDPVITGWWLKKETSWKMMEFVNGKDFPIYIISHIIYYEKQKMFETTNQIRFPNSDILA